LAAVLWLWGLTAQRQLVIKIAIALAVSLFVSWTMGHLFPHDRPFVENIGNDMIQPGMLAVVEQYQAGIDWVP
ncbi:hypothetical protein ACUOFC_67620, partial [Escherichia sp. TWPC-MK]